MTDRTRSSGSPVALGRLDAHDYLTIVGRADNMIISGGLKVHAEEVEAGLMQHPAVDMVAVVGNPDPDWGRTCTTSRRVKPRT